MGRRGLRAISFGNGQNRNKGSSLRNRTPGGRATAWTNGKGQKQTCHNSFSRCHEALTLVTFAELQAQKLYQSYGVCSDLGRRLNGSQHCPANWDANVAIYRPLALTFGRNLMSAIVGKKKNRAKLHCRLFLMVVRVWSCVKRLLSLRTSLFLRSTALCSI